MRRSLPYLAASLIVVASGLVQGLWTDRFVQSRELSDAITRISLVPMNFGDWSGKPIDVDQRQLDAAGIVGSAMRHYENRRDKRTVDILLVCGRPGPISVHTPDICYSGAGYVLMEDQLKTSVTYGNPQKTAQTWRGDFLKERSVVPSGLRILWSWNDGGGWKVSENPRRDFASCRALYKLYVVRQTNGSTLEPVEGDPGIGFLKELLPELERTLTPPTPGSTVKG